jgi:hypothetical protein
MILTIAAKAEALAELLHHNEVRRGRRSTGSVGGVSDWHSG